MPGRLADDAAAVAAAHRLAALFAPEAALRDRTRRLPWAELDAFVASGLWAISVPRAFGGTGVSSATLAEVVAAVSAADGSLGQIPQNHFFALEVLRRHGSAAQQGLLFGRVLAGERLGNALAEIGHKDFQRRTQLVPAGDGWRLDGRKFYCTGALYAHWIPTLALRTGHGQPGQVLVFVPRDAQGVTVTDDWDGFGQRVTGSGSVAFDGVHVRDEWVVPYAPSAEEPTTAGPLAQLLHAAIDLGLGQGALAAALELLRQNTSPDRALARQVGELDLQLRAARALVRRAGGTVDASRAAPDGASVAAASAAVAEARALTTTAALAASGQLFELAGPGSAQEHLGLDRFWRNVRTHTLHDPLRWRVHAVGDYHLNGKAPPRHGAI
ncbi:SfnB family sulfur acquisition oxidoreductase [Pseudorhodoferax sp. Leaf274]|nr:SfnB family sulfur acquisition oxidoreductase [Pseudorhodoferax sp. Leaf274]